ncbi:Type I inositol-3,4-bisphosphate 4-phosphatase [Phytophthora cinnamomi]|uniref:Type I inositol-3,4-bisphosphate 4-phosphatase n=1 Tax=Phytophthora cinnamomi TaxID=4785 RepID=UPI003559E696|nr:Type I inositol-3,4-bisphosphate 4-phosphatase [Phytophthora cinnamomi]
MPTPPVAPSAAASAAAAADAASAADDGLVFLPQASPALELLCVALYLSLALVAACRALSQSLRASSFPRSSFQRLLVAFALARGASFVARGVARNLLNRAALCLFFSLVLLQTLLWLDVANAKVSRRSRRLWVAFVVANGAFYAAVLGLSLLHEAELAEARHARARLERSALWTGVLPVLLVAAGSLASSLGLLYSTWQMRQRVARLLRPSGDGLRRRLDERVERKLTRALRFTALVMGACAALFLLRTVIYIQRPFSHQGCGDIRSADVCVVVGYALPELVPCALFLVLMWEVEPTLEIPSRRSLSYTSEATPLLDHRDVRPRPLLVAAKKFMDAGIGAAVTQSNSPPGMPGGYLTLGRRPSPLSLGLGNGVLDRAKRRLELVVRQHLGGGHREQQPSDRSARLDSTGSADSPVVTDYERQAKQLTASAGSWGNDAKWPAQSTSSVPSAWLSFQCFNLTLPSKSSVRSSSFVVLHLMNAETGAVMAEVGRTEISHSEDPCFHMMLAVEMREQDLLRASVYSVRNPNSLDDLDSQWLVGDPLVPLSSFMTGSALAIGRACIFSLYSPLSRTQSSGEIVIRCEAEVKGLHAGMSTDGLERITRSFMYIGIKNTGAENASTPDDSGYSEIAQQMINLASTSQRSQGKMLVEEELIESVYTWEVPYQLLQLILSDLLVKLDMLKREIALDDGDDSSSSTPSSQLSTPSVGGYSLPSVIPASPRALGTVQENEMGHTAQSSDDSESLPSGASALSSSFQHENRVRPATSIGMLSEMIIQIQDDVIERKKRKWRLDLVKTMEQYISEVEDSILRYGATQHAGLTFKPSTMKADADLRFLALNLHQQLMTVGNAAPTSENDVQYGDQTSAARYTRLVNSFVGALMSSPLHLSGESSVNGQQTDLDSVQFIDDDINDDDDVASSSPPNELPLEPVEALRRRVISFDSAETIVNKGASGQDIAVPSEQRKLAETLVAMGITEEEFQSIYGLDDNVDPSDGMDIVADLTPIGSYGDEPKIAVPSIEEYGSAVSSVSSVQMRKASMSIDTNARPRAPFYKHRMYGTTTVGAFAAHVYGFKSGGVRQMREELERLHARLVKEAQASSDLTMDALERKYNELKWDVERRLEVAFCQAMSALVTCFQQTLYVHTHDHRDFGPHPLKACGVDYLEMLTRVGFLFSVESLLSTYGNELGMLGDTEAAVKELGRVHIKLRPVKSPRAAAFRVSITSGPSGIVIELPIITRRASEFPDRSMHRVPGQDAVSGAIYLSLSTPEQKMRAKFLFQKPIRVVPVIFSQGLNEMQTVANTVGKASLQKEINMENVVQLEAYVNDFADWCLKKQRRDEASAPIYDAEDLDRIQASLTALKVSIQLSGRSKRMSILSLSSSIARSVGGGRVTMCKSAKDRTSMSITLEEANLLVRSHGLVADDMGAFTKLLRTYGVRRENARKNIGKAQYCFSALQNYMLPQDYQCPPGTGGGSRAYS